MAGADARSSTGLCMAPGRGAARSPCGAVRCRAGAVRNAVFGTVPALRSSAKARCIASGTGLQRAPEIMRDFADHAAAEGQHADHEDHALDHGDPLPEAGEILL